MGPFPQNVNSVPSFEIAWLNFVKLMSHLILNNSFGLYGIVYTVHLFLMPYSQVISRGSSLLPWLRREELEFMVYL